MDKLIKKAIHFAILTGMTTLYGCGGGGDDVVIPVITKGTAKMVFSTTLPAGSAEQFGTVQLLFELPAGVTVPADSSGAIASGPGGALILSGEALKFAAQQNAVTPVLVGKYTPAAGNRKATVNMAILVTPNNSRGLNSGEFASLTCDLVPGITIDVNAFTSISAELISITNVPLYDTLGGVTGPATASYAVTLQYPAQSDMTGATSGQGSL
ncbi:MAG: hypothetical protein ACOYL3_18390 [Desulfuromonadaceae bacterium]